MFLYITSMSVIVALYKYSLYVLNCDSRVECIVSAFVELPDPMYLAIMEHGPCFKMIRRVDHQYPEGEKQQTIKKLYAVVLPS